MNVEKYLVYFPANYKLTNYDQNFISALRSLSIETDQLSEYDRKQRTIIRNDETLRLQQILKDFFETRERTDEMPEATKYYCDRCDIVIEGKNRVRKKIEDNRIIGFINQDNKYLLLPLMARVNQPTKWARVEGREFIYYIDRESYRLIKDFTKKGKEVHQDIIDITFPALKNPYSESPYYFKSIRVKYFSYRNYCPICGSELKKRMLRPIKSGKTVLGFHDQNGNYYFNDKGIIHALSKGNGVTKILVPNSTSHLRNGDGNDVKINQFFYKGISRYGSILEKLSQKIRNMTELTGKENEDLDIIALKYAESLKLEISDLIKKGEYIEALKRFSSGVSVFDQFFIQGGRRRIGIPRKAVKELEYTFEALFNGSGERLFFSGIHLEEEWYNLIDLFLNVEKLKSKSGGRRHAYEQIVISTVAPLPPESYIRNLLNTDEVQIITGIWHGVKFVVTPNREKIGQYYKNYASKLSYILSKKEAKDIIKKIESGEYYVGVEGQNLRITREMVNIIPQVSEGYLKGKFKLGEFYLKVSQEKCKSRVDDLMGKINFERKKMKMRRDDPVDVIVPDDDCREYIDSKYNIIATRTNLRKLSFGDKFSVTPFYRNSLMNALQRYLDLTPVQVQKVLDDGIENMYVLQIGDIVSLPIKDSEIRGKILEARKKVVEPRDEIDVVRCTLCNGRVMNNACEECGFHY